MTQRRVRMVFSVGAACVLMAGSAARAGGGEALAATPTATACGIALSAAIYTEWRGLGGETGRLGCPTGPESTTSTSRAGAEARQADFAGGTIIWHTSGPRAGQAYAVVACYRRYFQFAGPSGWLGLPIGDAQNTPDGQVQKFEGGTLTYDRSLDACEDAHDAQPPPPLNAVATAPLDLFRSPAGDDFESIGSQNAVTRATAAQYARVRTEALVFPDPGPGLTPLKLYESPSGAHVTVASLPGERAQDDGATFYGIQGYVWSAPAPGAAPLKQYRNPATGREMLVATDEGEAEAKAAGYVFERIEGYAQRAP